MTSPIKIPVEHFAWAAFFKRIVTDWEGFGATYRFTPSLVCAGLFFTAVQQIQERFSKQTTVNQSNCIRY
jgi:hypothetical protein